MRILIVGDFFMLPTVFKEHVCEHLNEIVSDLNFRLIDWDFSLYGKQKYPDVEVEEFAGSPEELIKEMKDVEILIVHLAPVSAKVIDTGKNLKVIACSRGNPRNVNLEAATKKGIPVLHTPHRNADAVADYTFGLILAESRNIARAHCKLKNEGVWEKEFYTYKISGPELSGRTIGIIGFGTVGLKVALRARGFGLKILAFDPYVPPEKIESYGGKSVDLETLLKESDYVTIHVGLTPETKKMIGAEEISLMKPTAYLINTARGEIVDDQSLYKALKKGQIAGAALDVFEKEPLKPSDPFLQLDNVTLTPHIAGASKDVVHRAATMIAEDLKRIIKGETPKYIANPSVLKTKNHY